MPIFALQWILGLAALSLSYAAVDRLIRQDGFRLIFRRLGWRSEATVTGVWIAVCLLSLPFIPWTAVPSGPTLRYFALAIVGLLAWQAATKDIDIVIGEGHGFSRLLLLVAATGVYFHPAFVFIAGYLLTHPFGLWQHHATLPMRLTQALAAYIGLTFATGVFLPWSGISGPDFQPASLLVFFLVTLIASHYWITGLAKCMLGPKWYSWPKDNRLHHIAASAYSWGWARFLPWTTWLRVIRRAKAVEKPLQWAAFGLELLAPLALWNARAAMVFCLAWAGFHAGVFLLSGLLFWDWIAADLAMAALLYFLPPEIQEQAFGPWPVLASALYMLLLPMRHKLWKPMPLGWFDTPFTQRMHWRVRGASGKVYGLYNDFMCPHERLYGKVNACFMVPVRVITYHLGEVWKHDLRDAIRLAGPDLEKLAAVREKFGIRPVCEKRSANHQTYLRQFFLALNSGARKQYLPRSLRWLKAPGDQIFYWGDLPAYRRQERVAEITLHYREEYFDGERLQRLADTCVLTLAIDPAEGNHGEEGLTGEASAPLRPREPTPKEIDDFLLSHAQGKLIDLPGIKSQYLDGDDGRRQT